MKCITRSIRHEATQRSSKPASRFARSSWPSSRNLDWGLTTPPRHLAPAYGGSGLEIGILRGRSRSDWTEAIGHSCPHKAEVNRPDAPRRRADCYAAGTDRRAYNGLPGEYGDAGIDVGGITASESHPACAHVHLQRHLNEALFEALPAKSRLRCWHFPEI